MDIYVIWPGKIKNIYLNEIAEDYCNKIKKMIRFQLVQVKETKFESNYKRLGEEKKLIEERIPSGSYKVVLDVMGKQIRTMELIKIMNSIIFTGKKRMVFIGGSHNGLHEDIKKGSDLMLSLSSLEIPHELSRVVLLEQIYRVLCYINNIPYPK